MLNLLNLKPADALSFARSLVNRCFLCDSSQLHVIGAFQPDHPAMWLEMPVRQGKARALFYGLCRRCLKKSRRSKGEIVEEKLLALQAVERQATVH